MEDDYDITSLPTIIVLDDKQQVVNRTSGSNVTEVTAWIREVIAS